MHARHRHRRAATMLAALLLATLAAAPAHAGKLRVETDGVDSDTCGGKRDPCRTLTRAIAHARNGDTVIVGPGRYGDLDRDGVLGEGEEESPPTCSQCAVEVDKRLTVVSRAGAGVTIIDAGPDLYYAVFVTADGVAFGRKKRGFTVVAPALISLVITSDDVRVEGNLSTASNQGFHTSGDGTLFRGNSVLGNGNGGFSAGLGATDTTFIDNRAIGNGHAAGIVGSGGFLTVGDGATLTRNVAAANQAYGVVSVRGGDTLVKNVIAGNRRDERFGAGIAISYAENTSPVRPSRITRNLVVGNDGPGLHFEVDAGGTVEKNAIYGNAPDDDCGLSNDSGQHVDAPKNFWGDPEGPGSDPADAVCVTTGSVVVAPPARRAPRLRLPAAR